MFNRHGFFFKEKKENLTYNPVRNDWTDSENLAHQQFIYILHLYYKFMRYISIIIYYTLFFMCFHQKFLLSIKYLNTTLLEMFKNLPTIVY